jgi:hypothetical protein
MTKDEINAAAAAFSANVGKLSVAPPRTDLSGIYDKDDDIHFGSQQAAEERAYNWYVAYGAIARPKTILEIGVRRGYSAISLIRGAMGSVMSYVGIDSEIDIPDSNATAVTLLKKHAQCQIEVIKADTREFFPSIPKSFDLVHVDGNHSTIGTASDVFNVAPLLHPASIIIIDDIDNSDVALGVDIVESALGPRVIRRDAGDFHQQALLFVSDTIPWIPFSVAVSLAPASAQPPASIKLYSDQLRRLGSGGDAPPSNLVGDVFASILRASAYALAVPSPTMGHGDADIFIGFATLAKTLPNGERLLDLSKPHVLYAGERLRGVDLPSPFGTSTKLSDAFEPGSSPYQRMLWEVTCNLTELLSQELQGRQIQI